MPNRARRPARTAATLLCAAALAASMAAPVVAQQDDTETRKVLPVIQILLDEDSTCAKRVEPATAGFDDTVVLCGSAFSATSSVMVGSETVPVQLVDDDKLSFKVTVALFRVLLDANDDGNISSDEFVGTFPVLVDGQSVGDLTIDVTSNFG